MIGYVQVRISLVVDACKKYLAAREQRIQDDMSSYVELLVGQTERLGLFRKVVIDRAEAERRWYHAVAIGLLKPRDRSEADSIGVLLLAAEVASGDPSIETIAVDVGIFAAISGFIDYGSSQVDISKVEFQVVK